MRSKRFEKWFAARINEPVDTVARMYNGQTYISSSYHVELAWAAWCASAGFSV